MTDRKTIEKVADKNGWDKYLIYVREKDEGIAMIQNLELEDVKSIITSLKELEEDLEKEDSIQHRLSKLKDIFNDAPKEVQSKFKDFLENLLKELK